MLRQELPDRVSPCQEQTCNTWQGGSPQGQVPGSGGVSNSQQPGRTQSTPQRVNSQQVAAGNL
uniref:Uncharacterized protein n=1 Tax=Romanomermis culicivorax TaxID=13658 RepID=A0A915L1B6_ROMCU